ncbi:MAG TPA: hypothetical protein VHF69_08075, partial [Candidatus Synoicihabitans sp.]|nr:hypothetical protein [Candidatus Synoicihabitans sp.]
MSIQTYIPGTEPLPPQEPHLTGRFVSVVYRIEDPTEWRKTNPLHYSHHGLKAMGVSVGDLMERTDALRESLQ